MNRSRIVKVRVTETEYADWSKRALEASVSLSEAIRRAMKGNPLTEWQKPAQSFLAVPAGPTEEQLLQVIAEIAAEPCPHGRPRYVYCPKCAA